MSRRSVRVCVASNSGFGSSFDSLFEDMDREMSVFQRQACTVPLPFCGVLACVAAVTWCNTWARKAQVEREVEGAFKQARSVQESKTKSHACHYFMACKFKEQWWSLSDF